MTTANSPLIKRLRQDRQTLLIEAGAWRDLLMMYGDHRKYCQINKGYEYPCSCGFDKCKEVGFVPRLTD